jgi:RNA polymerase sigma-B factor
VSWFSHVPATYPEIGTSVMAGLLEPFPASVGVDVALAVAEPPVREVTLQRLAAARRAGDPRMVQRCESAVMERYRRYADCVARRYRGRGVEEDDLVQLARLGLCKAVRRWRPELDPTLIQFAIPTIDGEIKRYFRDQCRPIRMPRSLQQDRALHQAVQEELAQHLQRTPNETDIAAAAGSSVDRVRRQQLASRMCQPVSADPATWSLVSRIGCAESMQAFARIDAAVSIGAAVRQLSQRDRRILGLRFIGDLSQDQIAARIGVSQMQVSRILRSILTRLRCQLCETSGPGQTGD